MNNIPISVVITTYNRPDVILDFVNQITSLEFGPKEVIVVDSSEKENQLLKINSSIKYIISERKTQPYQRFLGFKQCSCDIICFFDDDVRIIDNDIFIDIFKVYNDESIVGVSAGINYETGVKINKLQNNLKLPLTGKISWLGRTTGLPKKNQYVEYFPGPIMTFRKKIVPNLFDEKMFSLFEKRIAMGEDKAISMKASKYGNLFFLGEKKYLYHPPIESTYFNDEISFNAKTLFSRLWLNYIYAEVRNKSIYYAYFFFFIHLIKNYFLKFYDVKKRKTIELAFKYFKENRL